MTDSVSLSLRELAYPDMHPLSIAAHSEDEIYLVTDSLVVASMVGGSGHGAGASCAGYTDLMDSHDDVFAY